MKQVFTVLAFCLVMSLSSGLIAQSSNTGRTVIPYSLACEIITKVQPEMWRDLRKTPSEMIQLYDSGVLKINQVGKFTFSVEVRTCIGIVILEDDL